MQERSHNKVDLKDATCLFCDKPAGSEDLHNASTYDIDGKVRQCAQFLKIALEAKYHSRCLTSLYDRARAIYN